MKKEFFITASSILPDEHGNPDVERFIERINYESMCLLEGSTDEYCKKIEKLIDNHLEIEEYEIAEGLTRTLNQLNEFLHDGKIPLSKHFFRRYGFSKPIRYWNERDQQFSIYYKIEGYDCYILVRPSPQVVPQGWNVYGEGYCEMPPEMQVDEFSDVKMLEDHHIGDFQIFVNSLENHIATFNYEHQMLDFMSICGCPLSCS